MSDIEGLNEDNLEEIGRSAATSGLAELDEFPDRYDDILKTTIADPKLHGIYNGFRFSALNRPIQESTDIREGVVLGIMALSRTNQTVDFDIPDFVPDGLDDRNSIVVTSAANDPIQTASQKAMSDIINDFQRDWAGQRQRLMTVTEEVPLSRGIASGIMEHMYEELEEGEELNERHMYQLIGLGMALVAFNVPHDMIDFEIPDSPAGL